MFKTNWLVQIDVVIIAVSSFSHCSCTSNPKYFVICLTDPNLCMRQMFRDRLRLCQSFGRLYANEFHGDNNSLFSGLCNIPKLLQKKKKQTSWWNLFRGKPASIQWLSPEPDILAPLFVTWTSAGSKNTVIMAAAPRNIKSSHFFFWKWLQRSDLNQVPSSFFFFSLWTHPPHPERRWTQVERTPTCE